MQWRALAVAAAGLAVAVAAELPPTCPSNPGLAAADATVGLAFIGLGVVAWERRPSSRSGLLMVATGFAWFAGSLAVAALFLHRGPLVHLLVGYPRGRLRSRLEQVVVAAYVDAVVYPLARQDMVTIALALAVVTTALVRFLGAGGPERRARAAALVAASAVALVLGLGAIGRLADADADATGLWAYQGVLVLVAVELFADLLWGRWTQAAITGLVVDLGEPEQAGTLQAKLARAVGDPSLVVAYRLPDADGYVDEAGRPVELPAADASQTVTFLQDPSRCRDPAQPARRHGVSCRNRSDAGFGSEVAYQPAAVCRGPHHGHETGRSWPPCFLMRPRTSLPRRTVSRKVLLEGCLKSPYDPAATRPARPGSRP